MESKKCTGNDFDPPQDGGLGVCFRLRKRSLRGVISACRKEGKRREVGGYSENRGIKKKKATISIVGNDEK